MRPLLALMCCTALPLGAQTAAPAARTPAQQIAAAVLPLPEAMRAGAAVFGWKDKALVPLRPGTNRMMCLSDDAARKGFHVVCYHKDLEPFMAAGRTRSASGLGKEAVDSARRADIAAKKWAMPRQPTMLYEYFGPEGAYDPASGTLTGAKPVYVVYTPYATAAELGVVGDGANGGMPWLMEPGTPWAHLMIAPQKTAVVTLK